MNSCGLRRLTADCVVIRYVSAKTDLYKKQDTKERLTEHLMIIIQEVCGPAKKISPLLLHPRFFKGKEGTVDGCSSEDFWVPQLR
jgi:hypothetical protein